MYASSLALLGIFASCTLTRPTIPQDDSINWLALVPDSTFLDDGSYINQTGLYLYTATTEIDDGGFPEVVFNQTNSASPFYIDETSSTLMGYQDYWGLQEIWMDESNFQGSLHTVTSGSTPQAEQYYYPTFVVDGDGYIQVTRCSLVWGWCLDRDGSGTPGSGYPYSPGTVVLAPANQTGYLESLNCTTFKGLKAVPTDAPSEEE